MLNCPVIRTLRNFIRLLLMLLMVLLMVFLRELILIGLNSLCLILIVTTSVNTYDKFFVCPNLLIGDFMEFKTAFNYDTNAFSDATGYSSDEPSLTQQCFLEETSLHYILDRYLSTGILPPSLADPIYADFTGLVDDFHQAQLLVAQCREAFDLLPAKLRQRFNDDPRQLMRFLDDRNNYPEAISLGLIDAPASNTPPADSPAPATPPTAGG